jgi:hypothetical protein
MSARFLICFLQRGAKTAYLGGFGRHFRSRFFADICGALKLFVKVAMIRSDTF